MKFKVIIGSHIEGGKTYTKGQVLNSTHQLDQAFPGKFQRVEGEEPAAAPATKKGKKEKPAAANDDDWNDEKE